MFIKTLLSGIFYLIIHCNESRIRERHFIQLRSKAETLTLEARALAVVQSAIIAKLQTSQHIFKIPFPLSLILLSIVPRTSKDSSSATLIPGKKTGRSRLNEPVGRKIHFPCRTRRHVWVRGQLVCSAVSRERRAIY